MKQKKVINNISNKKKKRTSLIVALKTDRDNKIIDIGDQVWITNKHIFKNRSKFLLTVLETFIIQNPHLLVTSDKILNELKDIRKFENNDGGDNEEIINKINMKFPSKEITPVSLQ